MNKETLKKYYTEAVSTFELTKINGEGFWAVVTFILAEEGHIDAEDFSDTLATLTALPAYASNMEKTMVEFEIIDAKKTAATLAGKYKAKAQG